MNCVRKAVVLVPQIARLWAGRCTRAFSSADQAAASVTYEQVKELLARRSGSLIDMREAEELRAHGSIPGAVNVPRE